MKKLGLIVNPIAGMGGRVGLKGTDGVLDRALELGAVPQASSKAKHALEVLTDIKDEIEIITCSGDMGEDISKKYGFNTKVIWYSKSNRTDNKDTIKAADKMLAEKVDLIVFAGGDGTARDIYNAVREGMVVIGIPSGVKIHSPVYAQSPFKAGELAKLFLQGKITQVKEAEVLDIDEEDYRLGKVNTKLYGYLKIPFEKKYMQNRKAGTPLTERASQNSIALDVIDNMEEDTIYVIGPGTTTRVVMENLGLSYTLLGVDLVCNKQLLLKDASEKQILNEISNRKYKLIITPIGGQGYLFGRGNQQISSEIIEKAGNKNIIVIATKQKISDLRGAPFLVDTGDEKVDAMLSGYIKVIVGYREQIIYQVKS